MYRLEGELKAVHGVEPANRHRGHAGPQHPDFVDAAYFESGVLAVVEAGLEAQRELGLKAEDIEARAETDEGMVDVVAAGTM